MKTKKTTPKTISVAGRIDMETYKKFLQFKKKNKIQTKSETVDIIITEYLEFTKKNDVTLTLQQKKKGGKVLLSDLSDITLKMSEFGSKLRKELSKK